MRGRLVITGIRERVVVLLLESGSPGASIALSVDGQTWSMGVESAVIDGDVPMSVDARFGLYSITKTVIAAMVLRLVERGEMSLDDPIGRHVSGLPSGADVSLRQVLNHSGGFPDYEGIAAYHAGVRAHPEMPWTAEEFLTRTMGDGMLFAPGEGWRYSNIGFMLLRQAIERVTRQSLREIVSHEFSGPLHLPSLAVAEGLESMAALTPGYSGAENVIPRYHPGWVSHGLVVGTAPELARFVDALFAGEVVGADSLREMLETVPVGQVHPWMTTPSYGLGLMIDSDNRFGMVAGHTGGGPGYSTAAYHFPDMQGGRVTSVALVNRDGRDTAADIAFSMTEMLG